MPTSFVDLVINIYKDMSGKNKKTGERVETEYAEGFGENRKYYDKDNRAYKTENCKGGRLVKKLEMPDEKTEIATYYVQQEH